MTALLRNLLLAAVAMSGLAGSAMADQTVTCAKTPIDKLWTGRCCGAGSDNCMGGDQDHGDRGRGDPEPGGRQRG